MKGKQEKKKPNRNMEGVCSPPVDGATASRRLKRGSWLPGITKRNGVTLQKVVEGFGNRSRSSLVVVLVCGEG